jgi:colicin import membrane protein
MNDPQHHPLTGHRLKPIGWRKPRIGEFGPQPIWPILGGSGTEPPPADAAAEAAAKAAADAKAKADADAKAAADAAAKKEADEAAAKKEADDTPDDEKYPKDKALADMTDAEKAAYWKAYSRKHETAFKSLAGANLTPEQITQLLADKEKSEREAMSAQDRAVAEAVEKATAETLAKARGDSVRAIMDAHIAASGLDKTKPDDQDVIDTVQALDPSSFIKDDHVDADRLTKVLNRIIPVGGGSTGPAWPATGQGQRNTGTGSARDAGLAEAERRGFVKKESTTS